MNVQPPAKKVEKAIQYFFEIRQENPELATLKIIEKTVVHFDLSPKESSALYHHLNSQDK